MSVTPKAWDTPTNDRGAVGCWVSLGKWQDGLRACTQLGDQGAAPGAWLWLGLPLPTVAI